MEALRRFGAIEEHFEKLDDDGPSATAAAILKGNPDPHPIFGSPQY